MHPGKREKRLFGGLARHLLRKGMWKSVVFVINAFGLQMAFGGPVTVAIGRGWEGQKMPTLLGKRMLFSLAIFMGVVGRL